MNKARSVFLLRQNPIPHARREIESELSIPLRTMMLFRTCRRRLRHLLALHRCRRWHAVFHRRLHVCAGARISNIATRTKGNAWAKMKYVESKCVESKNGERDGQREEENKKYSKGGKHWTRMHIWARVHDSVHDGHASTFTN